MSAEIIPTILVRTELAFRERLRAVERVAPLVHLDIMDGRFVSSRTWADPTVVARLRTPTRFEVHLMVREPRRAIAAWAKVRRVERIFVHVEADGDLSGSLARISATGKRAGLAVNPGTPLSHISPYLEQINVLLVMANDPGFSGRPFRPTTLRRISALRERFPLLPIGVDIGMDERTIPLVRRAGASFACAGSAVFGSRDPAANYRRLVHAWRRKYS